MGNLKLKSKEWTIIVYINAKNDLEKFGLQDVNEMEIVGSSDRVNVVVELGRMKGYDSSDGDWIGVRRYKSVCSKSLSQTHTNPSMLALFCS